MPRLPLHAAALVLAATLTFTAQASAQGQATLPANFQETVALSNLEAPTAVRFSPDGRVFVAEKSGLIKVYDSLADPSPTTFADLSTNAHNFWDRGLLGMVLAPNFPADPHVYVAYTYDAAVGGTAPRWGSDDDIEDGCPSPPGATDNGCVVSGRVSRLEASGNQMTGTEHVLINDWCQQFPSHSMGTLAFGADGALYVSAGDGASFNFADYGQRGNPCGDPPGPAGTALSPPTAEGGALRAQDLRTTLDPAGLNGSIIRVDPATGAGRPDNPQGLSSDPNARRIIANGMRNPFRFTFRPGTNELWVGDVGWTDWEEINRIPNPTDTIDNFGWPCYEGTGRQDSYDGANVSLCENLYAAGAGAVSEPYFSYAGNVVGGDGCSDGGASISGLAFYTGGNYPASYLDGLFFTDYSRECIWFMPRGADGLPNVAQRALFARGTEGPVDLLTGPGGDLFYVDFDFGRLMRITYAGTNQAPTAVATADPQSGPEPLTVQFDGTGSSDPEGGALAYEWDLDGDGAYDDSTAARPTFTYTQSRTWTVGLRVRDAQGATGTDVVVVTVGANAPPVPTITSPTVSTRWKVGDTINFAGSATDAEDGPLPASALSWKLTLRHCPSGCHTHPLQDYPGVAGGSFVAPDHEYPAHLELELTATDSDGVASTTMLRLDPQTVDLTFQASHPGLRIVTGSTSRAAPFTIPVIAGSENSISAPTPQTLGGNRYTFASWSDGGAQTHNIVATSSATYTATFDETVVPPVAAYAFDEGSGTTAADASGTGNRGTLTGATWSSQGRFGGAVSFDGVDDRVVVPDANSLDLTTGMTLEAWVRPSTLGSFWRTVMFKAQPAEHVYALYASDGSRPRAEVVVDGDVVQAAGTGALATSEWAHLAATYDGSALRLYVNGSLVTTTEIEGPLTTSTGELWIGGNPVWNEWFSGLIDEVRIYDRPLTAEQIQADMTTSVGIPDTEKPSAPSELAATGGRGSVALTWDASTDNVGVRHYNVHRSTTLGFTPTAANRIAQPTGTSYTDSGLAAGTYFYMVTAADDAGNVSAPSNEASGTATADTSAPTVAITAPGAGATVSGTVTVSATASDDDGVAGVQFKVDGTNAGSEDTTPPYSIQWDSRSVTDGEHTITAVARDPSGNVRTSDPRTIQVDNPTAPPPTGLVAAYAFDEGAGSGAGDASGAGNAGTVSGATWTTGGRYGGALTFDGVDDRVTAPDASSLDLTAGMTLEAWVRPAVGSGWRTAVAKEHADTVAYSLYSNRNTNVPSSEIYSGGRLRTVNGTSQLPLNTWSHVAATFDGSQIRIFVNGAQVGVANRTGTIEVSAGPLSIGGNAPIGEWFGGLIDEVRVYNRALSAAEIQADMATPIGAPDTSPPSAPGPLQASGGRGTVALSWGIAGDDVGVHHYDVHRSATPGFTPNAANRIAQPTSTSYLDEGLAAGTYHYVVRAVDAAGNVGAASNEATATATADTSPPTVAITAPLAGTTVSGTVTVTATASDDDLVSGVQFKVDGANVGGEDTSAPYTVQWDTRAAANGARDITAVARDRAGNSTTSDAVRVTVDNQATPPPTGLVASYGLNAGSGSAVADSSGNGNNGTIDGATWAAGGRFGAALSFDGTNDAVVVPDANSLDLTTGMTLEAWVRPTASGGRWRTVVAKAHEAAESVSYVLYGNRNTNVANSEVFINGRLRSANGTALPLNTWSHLASTYDGTTLRLFVNGIQVGQTAFAGAITPSAGGLWLGGNPIWSEWFAGLIDEVRVYDRALTAAQIQADMAAPVS